MATGNTSQSQPSYLNTIEEKPNFTVSQKPILLDQSVAAATLQKLCITMVASDNDKFQQCLHCLQKLFQKGYSYLFMTQTQLMRKMMNHFTALGKEIEHNNNSGNLQSRMLFILSIIAELLRENPKFYYPFTRKFLYTVFEIDSELLRQSPSRNDILAILAVIYENLSRQTKLLQKYGMESQLKKSVLENYQLLDEIFTIKTFNKVIANLIKRGVNFSVADFHKYRLYFQESDGTIYDQNENDNTEFVWRNTSCQPSPMIISKQTKQKSINNQLSQLQFKYN